ncbi:MAG: chloride channel protein [Treponema sp.]|jgi:H+/Cl- antiporter ClcA|nr:chloride channel protein [Treponema sp.]
MIKGSGIPQIKGALNRRMTLDWAPEFPLKLITGTLGLGAGVFFVPGGFITTGQNLNFMILETAAFFAAVVKAPVTGMVLILEMSGNFNRLGGLALVCLSAVVTTGLIASPPVYAVLLERMLKPPPPAGDCKLG